MNATISHFYKSQQITFVYYQVNSLEATVIMSYLSGREKKDVAKCYYEAKNSTEKILLDS